MDTALASRTQLHIEQSNITHTSLRFYKADPTHLAKLMTSNIGEDTKGIIHLHIPGFVFISDFHTMHCSCYDVCIMIHYLLFPDLLDEP